ncbi:hypothetical protein PV327_001482 [Microctonus hyperodae]|uniref:LYR motif-containing protein 2 n=2 Tax=Microctonus hyperodae TaxID=165561 RepID=A0AA39GAC8_MICHY|nr:hypothetical protein PV327_001482 [Microctonus hyperodae]
MSNKLPQTAMNLKQFMIRRTALTLYRKILRTIKQVPDKNDREYLKNWAKSEFIANKNLSDEFAIKSAIIHGESSMNELKINLNLAK